MSLDVTYHRLAELELCDAAQYYEAESPGLGAAFLNEVERCTALHGVVSCTAFPTAFSTRTHLPASAFSP